MASDHARGGPLENTADSDELNIVTEDELRQQQFARHESQSSKNIMVPPLHPSDDEPNTTNDRPTDPDLNEQEGAGSALRVSAEGDTDLLGRPLRPYITPLTRPVRIMPHPRTRHDTT